MPDLITLKIPIENNASLSKFTTFQLGGPCRGLLTCRNSSELEHAIGALNRNVAPFILIGGGSNLLVSDRGVDCYVIRYVSDTPIIELNGHELTVSGSTNLDDLALFAAEHGLQGLNCTTGIPGTVGGAVVGNAGAFGHQVGDVLTSASLLSLDGKKKEARADELNFEYRYSILKKSKDIVLKVVFTLSPGDSAVLLKEREDILNTRRSKHPDLTVDPCAGSFFRNIEPTSDAGRRQAAGWFLDQAGGKDLSFGGAKIYPKHANIIVKSKMCSSEDVFQLSLLMKDLVKDKFDLDLQREVRCVGPFNCKTIDNFDQIW